VVGVALAQLYPAQTQEPPSLERLMQQAQSLLRLESLPFGNNQPQETSANPATSTDATALPDSTALSASERQQLQVEMTQLQAELQTLTSQSAEPLAERVQEIQKRIQIIQERLSRYSAQGVTAAPLVASNMSQNHLMVTLPSDALFTTEGTLRPDETILNSILTDLQRYPGAAIQVSAHTDQQNAGTTDQDRSLEQAKAVQQYLSTQLTDEMHWVTIGYGHSRPLVPNDSPENRQRNRRIEILIKP
jgi:flagellar motor protein MotB